MRRDWAGARQFTERLAEEGNFAFLAPIIASWITTGERQPTAPVLEGKDRFASLARRYVDEHQALQAIGLGDVKTAAAAMQRALAVRSGDLSGMRLTFAGALMAQGDKADALALLPERDVNFTRARADIARGRGDKALKAALTPRQGFGRLLARLANDLSSEANASTLGIRLVRIALYADPDGAETQLVAAKLLIRAGDGEAAALIARRVMASPWHAALAQSALVDALAEAGQTEEAVTLARRLAGEADAGPDRHMRLGQLLAEQEDFAGAAAAFRTAQQRYPADRVPWMLLLFEGSALEQAEKWDEARAVLERAAKLAPEEATVLNYLGYAQIERRQNLDAALAMLTKASALKPEDASITDSLGWARFLTGDVAGAVPILERASVGAPADPTVNEHLGDALWAAGRQFEARYAWRAASAFAEGDTATRLDAKNREGMKPEYAAP
jgi:Flp pilus assembly protein TadD